MRLMIGVTLTFLTSFVTTETKPDVSLNNVVTLVGQKFEYLIGDEKFHNSYEIYKIVERGSKTLPEWLSFDRNSSLLVGVPLEKDVGIYNIRMRACIIEETNTDCQNKISRSFHIDVVEPLRTEAERGSIFDPGHAGNGYRLRHHGKTGINTKTLHDGATLDIHSVHDDTSIHKNLYIKHCDSGEIVFFASLVLHVESVLSGFELVFLINCMSKFLSKDSSAFKLSQYNTNILSMQDKHILTAGPGNVIESLNNSIELTWHVACSQFRHISDFSKVLQHNIDSGRLSEELGLGIIAWYVFTDRPLPERLKRNAEVGRRHTATPSFTPPLPSMISSSSLIDISIERTLFTTSESSIGSSSDLIQSTSSTSASESSVKSESDLVQTTLSTSAIVEISTSTLPHSLTALPLSSALASAMVSSTLSFNRSKTTSVLSELQMATDSAKITPSFTSGSSKSLPFLPSLISSAQSKEESFLSYFLISSFKNSSDIQSSIENTSLYSRSHFVTLLPTGKHSTTISKYITSRVQYSDTSLFHFLSSSAISDSDLLTPFSYSTSSNSLRGTTSSRVVSSISVTSSYFRTPTQYSKASVPFISAYKSVSSLASVAASFSRLKSRASSLDIISSSNIASFSITSSTEIYPSFVSSLTVYPSPTSVSISYTDILKIQPSSSLITSSGMFSSTEFSDTSALTSFIVETPIIPTAVFSPTSNSSSLELSMVISLSDSSFISGTNVNVSSSPVLHTSSSLSKNESMLISSSIKFTPISIYTLKSLSLFDVSSSKSLSIYHSLKTKSLNFSSYKHLLSTIVETSPYASMPVSISVTTFSSEEIVSTKSSAISSVPSNLISLIVKETSVSSIDSYSTPLPLSSLSTFTWLSDVTSLFPSFPVTTNFSSLSLSQGKSHDSLFTSLGSSYSYNTTQISLSSLNVLVSLSSLSFDTGRGTFLQVSTKSLTIISDFRSLSDLAYSADSRLSLSPSLSIIQQSDTNSLTEFAYSADSRLSLSPSLSIIQQSDTNSLTEFFLSSYLSGGAATISGEITVTFSSSLRPSHLLESQSSGTLISSVFTITSNKTVSTSESVALSSYLGRSSLAVTRSVSLIHTSFVSISSSQLSFMLPSFVTVSSLDFHFPGSADIVESTPSSILAMTISKSVLTMSEKPQTGMFFSEAYSSPSRTIGLNSLSSSLSSAPVSSEIGSGSFSPAAVSVLSSEYETVFPTSLSAFRSMENWSSTKIYTTAIPDAPPRLQNPINQLEVHIGKYYEYQIPYNTFNDSEDGNTRNLSLSVNLVYGKPLPTGAWLMFNETSQTLYGIPLWQDIVDDNKDRIMTVILMAKDSAGQIEKDAIQVVYNKSHVMGHSHKIDLEFSGHFKDFMQSRNNLIAAGKDLAQFYGDSTLNFLTFLEVRSGSLNIFWSNSSLVGEKCHRDEIQGVFDKIVYANGSVKQEFSDVFANSSLNITSAELEFVGICLLALTTTVAPPSVTDAPASSTDNDKMWIEVVIPALVAILLLVIVALILLICCRHRHSRKKLSKSEKPMFLEDRRPIIFPEELEMTDPNLKPKTPLVLPSDLVSDAPPPVPPHRGRGSPQDQAPATEDEVFLTDNRPPPPQFEQSQGSDPPPYRLPPPYFNPHRSQR